MVLRTGSAHGPAPRTGTRFRGQPVPPSRTRTGAGLWEQHCSSPAPQPQPRLAPHCPGAPQPGTRDPTCPAPPPPRGSYVDDVAAGVLVVVPDEEVDEDAPVELRVHQGQLLLQLPPGAWGVSASGCSLPGSRGPHLRTPARLVVASTPWAPGS